MKIAILINGYLRNGIDNYKYFNNKIFSNLDCDIFIHTWDEFGYHVDVENGKYGNKLLSKDTIDKLTKTYNPKKILIENQSVVDQYDSPCPDWMFTGVRTRRSHIAQVYSIYKSNELKKEYCEECKIKYDYCIRLRFDTKIFDIITKSPWPKRLNYDKELMSLKNFDEKNIYEIIKKNKKEIIYHDHVFIIPGDYANSYSNKIWNCICDSKKCVKYSKKDSVIKKKYGKRKFYIEFLIINCLKEYYKKYFSK